MDIKIVAYASTIIQIFIPFSPDSIVNSDLNKFDNGHSNNEHNEKI